MTETRYAQETEPLRTDGRDIDGGLGTLSGEASHQQVSLTDPHLDTVADTWRHLPSEVESSQTYYDRPLLKASVWQGYIPLYFYAGGAGGASLALGAAAQLQGSRELDGLVRKGHWIGIITSSIGAAFLIADLGRPLRFLNMLRVFRPTSPMNMGAWILAVTPPAAITAAFAARRGGAWETVGEVAGYLSGISGIGLATYTGVLLANSAVPVWAESRRILPVLFGASAIASAAALFDLLSEDPPANAVTRWYGVAGGVAEIAATFAMERECSLSPRVAKPFGQAWGGGLWQTARVLSAAAVVTALLPRQNRRKRVVAGILGSLASLALRFAVMKLGDQSAADPRASFEPQRERSRHSQA